MIAIGNCKYFIGSELAEGRTLLVEDGKITSVDALAVPRGYERFDANGAYVSPGFVDLQIYGSGGNLFSAYPSAETLRQMDHDLIGKGTTGFLACVATNTDEIVRDAIVAAKAYRQDAVGFLGLHLEGPFLNAKRRGAHVAAYIRKASLDEVKQLVEEADGVVKMMTLAAELQDDAVIHYLLDQGIVLSLGHSDASYAEANAAYDKGFKTTTHLFNAMPSIHHRAPNLPAAVYTHPTAMASIIADGRHVDFAMVSISQRLMGDRLFLITDAVTECNIGPYQHQLSGDKFITPDGTLSGSNITLLDAVRNCVLHCGISVADALKMASEYPARLMDFPGLSAKLDAGSSADLVLISEDLQLKKVMVKGAFL